MPNKKVINKKCHLKLNFITATIIIAVIIASLSAYLLWLQYQPSSLIVRMQSELKSLDLPKENYTIYVDDSGCKPLIIYDGFYCGRSVSYNYSRSLFESKSVITNSLSASGWAESEAPAEGGSKLNYLKKSDNRYFCLAIYIDASRADSNFNALTIESDEITRCKGKIESFLRRE